MSLVHELNLQVAVHEIGHVLGLTHIHRNYSVMFPMYVRGSRFVDFELGWEDRKEVQNIYGMCIRQVSSPPPKQK